MGNFIYQISERVSLIASDSLWLEDSAVQQLKITAQLPGMQQVVGLPDLHPGRGYPVGAAFFSTGRFYPALVGNDIGCGMGLWQTSLLVSKFKLDRLEKKLGNIDHPIEDDEWGDLMTLDANLPERLQTLHTCLKAAGLDSSHVRSLGTIGGGNHFAELQVIDHISDHEISEKFGIQTRQLQILVHSGSRGLGQEILRAHVDSFGHSGLAADSTAAVSYLRQHDAALEFAMLNRKLIALRIFNRLHCSGEAILDAHHNTVEKTEIGDQMGWLHRKGASPSDQGLLMLPGSRGDYSYLIAPIASGLSLNSVAHGAGRKWQRTDCKDRLIKLASAQQLSRTALGSRVICEDRALIYEEAPQAYKNVDSVLDCLIDAGLARVIARHKPLLTYKTRGECCT